MIAIVVLADGFVSSSNAEGLLEIHHCDKRQIIRIPYLLSCIVLSELML